MLLIGGAVKNFVNCLDNALRVAYNIGTKPKNNLGGYIMKKTHLLWKILVVVMIVSAMMATFVACSHDCDKDGHIDENKDYLCDACGADMCPGHVDTDPRDHKCDVCGRDVNSCALGSHVDTNGDMVCDDCTELIDTSSNWNALIGEIDKVIASMGSMGKLATMGGSLTAGIDFVQGATERDIDLALDFGLQLETFAEEDIDAGSGNAFGFSIMDGGDRIFGLWYVDNGSEAKNYILGQFGKLGEEDTEVIKFKAPSLAETFNTYTITVNNDMAEEVAGKALSTNSNVTSIIGLIGTMLPLSCTTEGTTTTYSIPLTNILFNENLDKPMANPNLNTMLGSLISEGDEIYALLSALGLKPDLTTLLSDLLPGLTLDIAFTKDTNGNTTGAALGLGIKTPSGVLHDIFSVEAEGKDHLVITDKFEDIDLDVSLSYAFGSNAFTVDKYPYAAKVAAALEDVEAEFAEKEVTPVEIGLLNIALETDITLGMNGATASTYNLKLAASLDPSALTTPGLLKPVYVVDGEGKGAWTDKNENDEYDPGEENMTVAINFGAGRNVVDVIYEMIDSLYLRLDTGDGKAFELSKAGATVTNSETGKVTNFPINISGIANLKNLLGSLLPAGAMNTVNTILNIVSGDGENINLATLDVSQVIGGLIEIKGVSDTKPTDWQEHKDEESKDEAAAKETKAADDGVDAMKVIGQIADYIKMFKFDRDGDSVSVSIDNAKMNGAEIDFDATASALRGEDNKVNGLKLELGETGLVIKGSDKVNTTIKLDKPLQIGGDNNLFSVQVTAEVDDTRDIKEGQDAEGNTIYYIDKNGNGKYDEPVKNDKGELVGDEIASDKSMKLTLGLDVKKLGYGIVRDLVENETEFNSLFSADLDHLFISSTPIASATE